MKDGHSSGPISHLWSQGVVSAEAFVSDAEFRKKLRAKVSSLGGGFEVHLPKSTDKVVREDYGVVYGIMRKPYADGTLGLPFFSKVSLQAAAERIGQFGIPLAIELIEKPASDDAEERRRRRRMTFDAAEKHPVPDPCASDCWWRSASSRCHRLRPARLRGGRQRNVVLDDVLAEQLLKHQPLQPSRPGVSLRPRGCA